MPQNSFSSTPRGPLSRTPSKRWSWLKNRKSPKLKQLLELETTHYQQWQKEHQQTIKFFHQDLMRRIRLKERSYPVSYGGYEYCEEYHEQQEFPILLRRPVGQQDWLCILDLNEVRSKLKCHQVGDYAVSPNQRYLAFATDASGQESFELHVKDLQSGKIYRRIFAQSDGSIQWHPDSKSIFAVKLNRYQQPARVVQLDWRDSPQKTIYNERQRYYFTGCYIGSSRRYLYITGESHDHGKVLIYDLNNLKEVLLDFPGRKQRQILVDDDGKDFWYIESSRQKPQGVLMRIKIEDISQNKDPAPLSKCVIKHDPLVNLEGIECFADFKVLWMRIRAQQHLVFLDDQNQRCHSFEAEDACSEISECSNPDFLTRRYRISVSGLKNPDTLWEIDPLRGGQKRLKRYLPRNRFKADDYHAQQIWLQARDQTEVPVTLLRRSDLKGPLPTIVEVYGAYGDCCDISYSLSRSALVDRGFMYAIVHARGGGECGNLWHWQARVRSKKKTFYDIIDCCQALLLRGDVEPQSLALLGGSAGGLAVAACLNLKPQLFAAAVLQVPFVDVLATMQDKGHALTPLEYDEWGHPDHWQQAQYIRSYSPCDQIKQRPYPPMLLTVSLNDARVGYWEPLKYAQLVRHKSLPKRDVLCRIDDASGHEGAPGRFEALDEWSEICAFFDATLKPTKTDL